MNIMDSGNRNTLIVGLLFMAVVFFISYIRNLEAKRLKKRLGEGNLLLSAFNVNFYGVESEEGRPLNSIGALGLSSEGLYYRARYKKKEFFIPGRQLSSLSVTDDFKGKNMYGNVVIVNFINVAGGRDRAAFRIPFPEKWSQAINQLFLSKKV